MGTKMKKLMTILLLPLFVGLLGGSLAFAQPSVGIISEMKITATNLEDKGMQDPTKKAEGALKEFQCIDCIVWPQKALSGSTEKK